MLVKQKNLPEGRWSGSAQFAGYEHQDYALVEILNHQRRYSKVEK